MIPFILRIFISLVFLLGLVLFVKDLFLLFVLLFLYVLVHGFYAQGMRRL